jgi:hypothetical protein
MEGTEEAFAIGGAIGAAGAIAGKVGSAGALHPDAFRPERHKSDRRAGAPAPNAVRHAVERAEGEH